MQFETFKDLIATCAEAQRWRPLSDRMIQELYGRAIATEDGIGEDALFDLVTGFLGTPNQTPAHLLQAIREEKLRQFRARAGAGTSAKSYGEMTEAEKDSYVATIRGVKEQLIGDLASLGEQGKIPTTKVSGFSAMGGILAKDMFESGMNELALERQLASLPTQVEV